jgi:hypothetical protein
MQRYDGRLRGRCEGRDVRDASGNGVYRQARTPVYTKRLEKTVVSKPDVETPKGRCDGSVMKRRVEEVRAGV